MNELEPALASIASAPVLLVASDYDGTLAPIVADPDRATPQRESIVALRGLSALPRTHVAIISGRGREALARLTGLSEGVHLVGSHGSEFEPGFAETLPPAAAALRDQLIEALAGIAAQGAGFTIEPKPAGVAFHYRNAHEAEAAPAVEKVLTGPGAMPGVFTKQGKKVVELSVVPTSKGDALEKIRHRCGASAVIFLGDDQTDEDAFAALTGPDVGVKVGSGETAAAYRIAGPREVAQVLDRLSELRAAWLAGAAAVPLERPSMRSEPSQAVKRRLPP